MKKEDTTVTIKLDEFRELYKHKVTLQGLVKYMNKCKNNEPFEFMVDDLLHRAEVYLYHYDSTYEKKEGGSK